MRGDPWIVNLRCQMVTERETDGQDRLTVKQGKRKREILCVCVRELVSE